MYDALSVLQAQVTKTATFNGAGVLLSPAGTPLYNLVARVLYSAATNASGSNAVAFEVQHSDDNSTWFQLAVDAYDVVNLSPTAQAGEIFIPLRTARAYVRLVATFSGAGATPSIVYSGDVGLTKP